jgi:hypothetical protein
MNAQQQKNVLHTADAIGEDLALAWNYVATLRALQRHARSSPNVIDRNNHFFSTITSAIWEALLLKLSHCSDKSRNALGFPKLFKQLRTYLPQNHALLKRIEKNEHALKRMSTQSKVEKWRHEVIAHHTPTANTREFFEKNRCSLDEIEKLVSSLRGFLQTLSIPLWNLGFKIKDHGPRAYRGVNKLIAALKEKPNRRLRA